MCCNWATASPAFNKQPLESLPDYAQSIVNQLYLPPQKGDNAQEDPCPAALQKLTFFKAYMVDILSEKLEVAHAD